MDVAEDDDLFYTFDMSFLTEGLYLGKHTQCSWNFHCSAAGPANTLNLSIPVVDLEPPVTSPYITSGIKGNNGWFTSDIQITLKATDLPAGCGSGVQKTVYSRGSGHMRTYTGPFILSDEGPNMFMFYSIDNAGNIEKIQIALPLAFRIDKTKPVITGAPTTKSNNLSSM